MRGAPEWRAQEQGHGAPSAGAPAGGAPAGGAPAGGAPAGGAPRRWQHLRCGWRQRWQRSRRQSCDCGWWRWRCKRGHESRRQRRSTCRFGGQATGGGLNAGAGGGGSGAFALTSSKLTAGAAFPTELTCASNPNHSPPLAWTPGPSAALSYALVLLDTNNSFNHWVVWDIPPATRMLPEALPTTATLTMPAGAKQASGQGMGYLGPCPGGTAHTYKFTLYALDVATLPGVTTSTSTANLAAAIEMHDIASASLSATSDAKKP